MAIVSYLWRFKDEFHEEDRGGASFGECTLAQSPAESLLNTSYKIFSNIIHKKQRKMDLTEQVNIVLVYESVYYWIENKT